MMFKSFLNYLHMIKKNNSLYSNVIDMERRVQSLEHSASGNIYSTVKLRGVGSALQVDDACPYGILSRIGGNVSKITVGLPFDTAGTLCHTNGVSVGAVTPDSVTVPIGEKYNIKIPCNITAPCTVTLRVSENGTAYVNKGGLMDRSKSQIGSQVNFRDGASELALEEGMANAEYICITKTNQGSALSEPFVIEDIMVTVSAPTAAEIMYVVDEIEIPEEVRGLSGYGEAGAYIDLTERRFYRASGESVDISAVLPAETDVLSLLPSALIRFSDADGNTVVADYEIVYKNRI